MLSEQLIEALHKLNRTEKLRAVQLLVNELAAEEAAFFQPGMVYEIATPYGNEAAAEILLEILEAEKTEQTD